MFLKLSKLKKLMKQTYKTCGLIVGHREGSPVKQQYESYYISSGWWILEYKADLMPKELKAAVIELAGELPGPGEQLVAVDGEVPQYEIVSDNLNAQCIYDGSANIYYLSTVSESRYNGAIRYLYDDSADILAIRESIIDMLDINSVDTENGENYPDGPFAANDRKCVVWKNNQSILVAFISGTATDDIDEINYRKQLGGLLNKYERHK